MNGTPPLQPQAPLAALRRFAKSRRATEPCELCGAALAHTHQHLFEPAQRRIVCSCDACAILFSGGHDGRFRRVPRESRSLTDFQLRDEQWNGLLIPINVAFLVHSTPANRVIALYPSPAGATEAAPAEDVWAEIQAENPLLRDFEPDVEALLVNRLGETREYYRAPIDECYRLVGLVRLHWRGLSGGVEVWVQIGQFFTELRERARAQSAQGVRAHA